MLQKIQTWIDEQARKYPVSMVEIQHSSGARVDRCILEPGVATPDFASAVWRSVQEDTEAYPGQECVYTLLFFKEGGDGSPECRKNLRISADASISDLRSSEGPDERGLVTQAMRHQEVTMKTAERMTTVANSDLAHQNAQLFKYLDESRQREMEGMMLLRKTLLDQSEMEMRRESARNEAMIYQKLIEQAEILLPVALGHLLKPKKGSEEEKRAQEQMENDPPIELKLIVHFFALLKPEQLDRMGAVLNMAQRAALAELRTGEIPPEVVPILVSRIMNGLSSDQVRDLYGLIETQEQADAFSAIYRTRKLSLDWQKNAALEEAKTPQAGEASPAGRLE